MCCISQGNDKRQWVKRGLEKAVTYIKCFGVFGQRMDE